MKLNQALGTGVDVSRMLRELGHLTSYSHRGGYYTLREIAHFDANGLWSCRSVWFSRYGTLLNTAEASVNQSPAGYFADELPRILHVDVRDALLHLIRQGWLPVLTDFTKLEVSPNALTDATVLFYGLPD